jgi:hypothetical protein
MGSAIAVSLQRLPRACGCAGQASLGRLSQLLCRSRFDGCDAAI